MPDFVGSANDVATIFTNGEIGTEVGAVYTPEDVMVPHVIDTQPKPLTVQVTALFEVPVTVAVKGCCPPVPSCTLAGDTATDIWVRGTTITVEEPDTVGIDNKVAVTATTGGVGAMEGAV